MRRVARIPWHPLLIAAAWVLNAYVAASPSPYAAMRALLLAVLAAAALTVVGRLVTGGWHRGALAATAVILLMTLSRDVGTVLSNIIRVLPTWQALLLGSTMVVGIALAAYLMRAALAAPRLAVRIGSGLNVVVGILVLVIALNGIGRNTLSLGDFAQGVQLADHGPGQPARDGPDVYVILLDGYPSPDSLLANHGIDVSDFLGELRSRGFGVDPASHSNYLLTQLTVTSMLHMAHVTDIPGLDGVLAGDVPAQPTARRILNANPAFEHFRTRGYTVVSFAIPFEHPALRQADVLVELGGANEFERQLVASSLLLDVWNLVDRDPFAGDLRSQIDTAFDQIGVVAADRGLGPRVLFAHVLSPRPPFLFDAGGNAITSGLPLRQDDLVMEGGLDRPTFSRLLADQIAYINDRTLTAVDAILAASDEPPVIVLMSDHGTRTEMDAIPSSPAASREAFGTLFAALTPGREEVFPTGVTPTQVLPSLMNSYFGTDIPLASAETYASAGRSPFQLIRVPDPSPPD